MRTSIAKQLILFCCVSSVFAAWEINGVRLVGSPCCSAQLADSRKSATIVSDALSLIKQGGRGITDGFVMLRQLQGECPDEILELVHTSGPERDTIIFQLGLLIADFHLTIRGERLLAEYDKAKESDTVVRPAICALASYQTGRRPAEARFGGILPAPKPLDEATLNLLVRALQEKEPKIRIAAAEAIRFSGIPDERFVKPLMQNVEDEWLAASNAAAMAAADLGFEAAAPLILKRLQETVTDKPNYIDTEGWIAALGTLEYQAALPLLRKIASPFTSVDDLPPEYTAGQTEFGFEDELATAILNIENKPNRAEAMVQMAEDSSLAGNVRVAALRMFEADDNPWWPDWSVTEARIEELSPYYAPELIRRVVILADDSQPISENNELSRLGRVAIEVAAKKLDPYTPWNDSRLRFQGTPLPEFPWSADEPQPSIDPNAVYPESLLAVRTLFADRMERLLKGDDGPLALEALAVACPDQQSVERFLEIATDTMQRPELRVVAATLMTWQPFLHEMHMSGTRFYGKKAPPEIAVQLVPLLELHRQLDDWLYQDQLVGLFGNLLGHSKSELSPQHQTAREQVIALLRAMKSGRHAKAAEEVLESLEEH